MNFFPFVYFLASTWAARRAPRLFLSYHIDERSHSAWRAPDTSDGNYRSKRAAGPKDSSFLTRRLLFHYDRSFGCMSFNLLIFWSPRLFARFETSFSSVHHHHVIRFPPAFSSFTPILIYLQNCLLEL